ncbi:hypothetical protein WME94_36995 [Sorangium sp. So ce429]
MASYVRTSAERVLAAAKRNARFLNASGGRSVRIAMIASVDVNAGAASGGSIHVDVVLDAATGTVDDEGCPLANPGPAANSRDRDEWSVLGLCEAHPLTGAGLIRCSADGIAALIKEDLEQRRDSRALDYVLAHEMSHLAHGDARRFLPPVQTIKLGLPVDVKWSQISSGCDPRSESTFLTLSDERRADDDALEVLDALVLEHTREDPARAVDSLAGASFGIWRAASSLKPWISYWENGANLPDVLENAPVDANAEYVEWAARRAACDVLSSHSGVKLFPVFNATHPSEPERLALISARLAELASRYQMSDDKSREMLSNLIGANALVDLQQRGFLESFETSFCRLANLDLRPVCSEVLRDAPVHASPCPSFEGRLSHQSLSLRKEPIAIAASAGKILAPGRVRAALRLASGTLIGLTEPDVVAIVPENGPKKSLHLPCSPAYALEQGDEVAILCDRPFGLLTLRHDGSASLRALVQAKFDGNDVDPTQVSGGWLGRLDDVLLATVHIPAAGKSSTIVLGDRVARTAQPWVGPACQSVFTAMGVWRFEPKGPVFGAAWNSRASGFVGRFDSAFTTIDRYSNWAGKPSVFACGPFAPHKRVMCGDVSGTIFDPLSPEGRESVARFSASPQLSRSKRVRGRICSTSDAVFVQSIGEGGTGINEIFAGRSGYRLKKIFSSENTESDLICSKHGAAAFVASAQRSDVILLVPPG